MSRTVASLLFTAVLAVAVLPGCASPPNTATLDPQITLFTELADLLRAAVGAGNRPPAKVADLAKFEQQFPRAYQAVKSGDVVVLWGTPMKGEGDSAAGGGNVVAYEKDAPTAGGYVLLTSGQVKKMTAAEFAAAKGGRK